MAPVARRVVLIHGLPAPGQEDAAEQVAPLAAPCLDAGLEVDYCRWANGSAAHLKVILGLLRDPNKSFTREYARLFHRWMEEYLSSQAADTRIALVAYSLSGAFLYRWLQYRAWPGILSRVSCIVTIGAPYRVPNPLYLEQRPGKPMNVYERPLNKRRILVKLERAAVPMRTVLAWDDGTIPVPCALFPHSGSAEGGPVLRTLVIPDARHLTLCDHWLTHAYLRRWLEGS